MLNLVDRALMMLLLQPIKEDLQLSDTQLGLLTGIAFGLFYATFGGLHPASPTAAAIRANASCT